MTAMIGHEILAFLNVLIIFINLVVKLILTIINAHLNQFLALHIRTQVRSGQNIVCIDSFGDCRIRLSILLGCGVSGGAVLGRYEFRLKVTEVRAAEHGRA